MFRIIAIDPDDAQKIFLLVLAPTEQALAISTDGGATFTTPLHYGVALTAFGKLAGLFVLVIGSTLNTRPETPSVNARK